MKAWRIVGLTALFVGVMVAMIVLFQGMNEQAMRMSIRATGRTSLILFLSAFIASSLFKLWSSPFSSWLNKNRRFLGISMAVSHTYHAIVLFGLWYVTAGVAPTIEPVSAFGYVLLYAMAITSFKSPAELLGKRNWKILHTIGMHFLWFGLLVEYGIKLSKLMLIALPFFILLVIAMVIRIIAARNQQKLAS
jgi:DMSO/TMAO reductase YedYZ heme-binding membrane subunit